MNYFSICAIFRQESQWLEEWLDYGIGTGVDHFYLYCDDDDPKVAEKILDPYVKKGVVSLFYTKDLVHPLNIVSSQTGRIWYQPTAMKDCLKRFTKQNRWIAFIDLDEFIYFERFGDVKSFMEPFEAQSALALHWKNFGTNGFLKNPETQINHLTTRPGDDLWLNRYVKSIVNPVDVVEEKIDGCNGVAHLLPIRDERTQPGHCRFGSDKIVYSNFDLVQSAEKDVPRYGQACLCHYPLRSYSFYWEVKSPRGRLCGRPDHDEKRWEQLDRNEVFDDEISKRFGHFVR